MQISLNLARKEYSSKELVVIGTYSKSEKNGHKPVLNGWDKDLKDAFHHLAASENFTGDHGSNFYFDHGATRVLAVGLGEKSEYDFEKSRRAIARVYKAISNTVKKASIDLDSFIVKGKKEETLNILSETLQLTAYTFNKYKTKSSEAKLKEIIFESTLPKSNGKKLDKELENAKHTAESINVCRDFVNEPPNTLYSTSYSKEIEKDVKKNLKGVKVKILGKQELKKEKMGMFLSVNAGSAHEPRLVHLTYTPAKATKKTKHIALVGKGLTFDTGGYSLKPSGSINNMKFDMAGSATMYAAFRAAVLLKLPVKVSCFLGLTDNAVSRDATMPDSIVTARNGKTVEILNTDAEGRLVLGDVMDYACDFKPDALIDCATLTGACLIALGTEVCGLMGNDQKLADSLLKSAKNTDEYMWQLPIIQEWKDDIKSPIADLKNIGGSRWGGTAKAAAFLENFVQEGVSWAHLDIAGVADSQSHLPYCPSKGGSGVIVRTLIDFIKNA